MVEIYNRRFIANTITITDLRTEVKIYYSIDNSQMMVQHYETYPESKNVIHTDNYPHSLVIMIHVKTYIYPSLQKMCYAKFTAIYPWSHLLNFNNYDCSQ